MLLVLAALFVLGAVISGSFLLSAAASVLGVVLGAAATRITHSELQQSRRDWARDRAAQAKEYAELTARRTAENADFAASMKSRIAERETAIEQLEESVAASQTRVAELTRKMSAEARRADLAEGARDDLQANLDAAENRAAEAIVRMAELEQEIDVLRAELDAWTALANEPARKHA